jgi:phosphatidate cytidylyltransferase
VWKRLASAVVLVPLLVWLILRAPAWLFHALVIALGAAAVWELGRMFERAGRPSGGWLAVGGGTLITASFLIPGGPVSGPVVALALAIVVTLSAPLCSGAAPSTDRAATTLLGLTWVSWLLGHAILLRRLPSGAELVLFLVGVTWVGESAAYAVGSSVGRRKLAPVISPRKTVEGAVAQVLASLLAALVLWRWLVGDWSVWLVLGAGLMLGVVGQVGDLAESVIKRTLGTKDTGGLIPGHGGVLDRLDSLLFNTPAFFYLVTLGGGHR